MRVLGARRASPDVWAVAAITVAVVLANLPYLAGWFSPNPLPIRSGLQTSVTHGLLQGKPTIDPNVGYSSQAIGHLAALDLLHLGLPWWNSYEVTGMPLAGETQAAALFPPTLLTALANGQLYEHLLLEWVGGICSYLLLRRLLVVRWAATAGGVAFALNGTYAWFAHAAVNPVAFLPMLLLGIERAFSAAQEGRRGGWRVLAVAAMLSVYAGFPEVAYIDGLLGAAWIAWRSGCLERRLVPRFLAKTGLGAVAGVLLAAPIAVAMADYLTHADIGLHTTSQLGGDHLIGSSLPQLFMPYLYGPINGSPRVTTWLGLGGYVPPVMLALAAVGVFARGRRGLSITLVAWIVLVFARMYGQPPLLGHVIGVLPDMSRIEFYRYAWPGLEMAVIVLAALGLDDLARVPEHRWRLAWSGLAVGAFVAGGALGAHPVLRALRGRYHAYFVGSVLAAAATVTCAAAVALVRHASARSWALAGLLTVEALGLFVVPQLSAPRAQHMDLAPVAYLRRHLGNDRFFTLGPIQPNYGSYFGLATLNVNDFIPRSYAAYVRAHLDRFVNPTLLVGTNGGFRPVGAPSAKQELLRNLNGYRAAAVRYVLAPRGDRLPQSPSAFTLVFRSPTTWIYHLNRSESYFSAAGCMVQPQGRESAEVSCSRPTTLVRRETWFAGWQADIDGRPAIVQHADGLFQAVTVPSGRHRVVFSFEPANIGWGGLGFLAGLMLMLSPSVAAGVLRRHPVRGPSSGSPAPAAI